MVIYMARQNPRKPLPAAHVSRLRAQVAAEVRAELARQRLTQQRIVDKLGRSQAYWSRRVNGEEPFDLDDLASLAALLDVPIGRFIPPARHREHSGYDEDTRRYLRQTLATAA